MPATQVLLFCRGLDEHTVNVTVPGTYGTILATLRHIIYCEIVHQGSVKVPETLEKETVHRILSLQ